VGELLASEVRETTLSLPLRTMQSAIALVGGRVLALDERSGQLTIFQPAAEGWAPAAPAQISVEKGEQLSAVVQRADAKHVAVQASF